VGRDGPVPHAGAYRPGANSEFPVNPGRFLLDKLDVIGDVAGSLREHATP